MNTPQILNDEEMKTINDAMPSDAKYGDVFEAIAQAQLDKDKPLIEQARQEGRKELIEAIERERFAEPQYIPQSGREPVIICLTENIWQEITKSGG